MYIYPFFFIVFLFSFFIWSGETTMEVEQNSPDTKKAVQTAIRKVSIELMEQFIEPSKLKAQKKQIQKIISARFNRYILSTHTAPPIKKDAQSFIIPVTIGFSEKNLKKILLEEDLFYSGTSYLRILPLILFEDLVERENYAWWIKKKNQPISMKEQISEFYNQIQSTLMSYGFFLINPELAGSRYFIPDDLLFTKPKKRNIFNLAHFFQSNLVMTGSVKIRESDVNSILNLKVELMVYHADSGRLLAEIKRFAKIRVEEAQKKSLSLVLFLKKNQDFAKGLGVQLKSIYEAGQISSNLLKITVQGSLNYKESNRFKHLLNSKVQDIKDLQENIIQSKSITYIASTNSSVEEVSKKIKDTLFPGFYVRVSRVRKNQIILKVVPKK